MAKPPRPKPPRPKPPRPKPPRPGSTPRKSGARSASALGDGDELDGVELVALADLPGLLWIPRGARAAIALAHGAGAGMRHPFLRALAAALAQRGIATLRWEFPYMAEARARPDRPAVAEAAVRRAWNELARVLPEQPRFAAGKSFGGRMTSRAHAAEPLADCRGVILVGFPHYPIGKPDGHEAAAERAEHLPRTVGPLLFVQGTRDELAPLDRLRPVVAALGSRARLHVVDDADHGFAVPARSGRAQPQVIAELAAAIDTWVQRILDS